MCVCVCVCVCVGGVNILLIHKNSHDILFTQDFELVGLVVLV